VPDASPAPIAARLTEPVSSASLAAFRVAFGLVMAVEAWRYLTNGWVQRYYVEPVLTFSYPGFGWVRPLPEPLLTAVFVGVGVSGLLVALGWRYRLAAGLLALGTAYVFLLDQARYLNHFYLLVLLAGLLAVLPADRGYALDARGRPALRVPLVPAWAVWALRAQVGLVYAFAAVAKMNPDWLAGEPIGTWVADGFEGTALAPLARQPWTGRAFAWGGLATDALAVPLLLWGRTRVGMTVVLVAFHLMNAWTFTIGVFPWLMILALGIFYPPDWPARLAERARGRRALVAAAPGPGMRRPPRWVPLALGAYFVVQLALPLRHWFYPGDVAWTEEGHLYSWRMKLRDKEATRAEFHVVAPERGASWSVRPADVLTNWQAYKMTTRPDMILQFAHHLAAEARALGHGAVRVYAEVEVSLNGRPPQPLVDPAVDLAAEPRSWRPKRWVLPLGPPRDPPLSAASATP
jgi:vitamin K-dependent gamma-carboxylase